jgi:hypothetical protein
MAVVRTSRELVHSVLIQAANTYTKRIDTVQDSFSFPYTGHQLYNTLFAPWLDNMRALPDEFFYVRDKIDVRKIGYINMAMPVLPIGTPRKFPKEVPLEEDFFMALSFGGHSTSAVVELKDSNRWRPLFDAAVQWRQDLDAVISEKDQFVASVRKVLSAHNTINAALKAWPALWELLPDATKDRIRTPVSRSKSDSKNVDLGVDVNKLTAIVAASKIL